MSGIQHRIKLGKDTIGGSVVPMARRAGVHPAHLAATFRRFYHTTVGEFIQQLRVEAACDRMRQLETPLSEIALELGFADQSHFSRIFRRSTGLTPKAWRSLMTPRGMMHE